MLAQDVAQEVAVAICILDHPIADTKDVASVHIVIPPKQARPYKKDYDEGEKRKGLFFSLHTVL